METPEDFGRAERLLAAIRGRGRAKGVDIVRDEETGLSQVRIAYRDGAMLAEWTGATYRWRSEDGPWETLGADPEDAAKVIVPTMDVRTTLDGDGGP
ncbi:hypothetical protein D0T12_01595 [Actinomadura spongiicola]|uniref:Uncharacterized protein n=1 Tax=Actinomadura spongiicola TaxID=2303421 RepID=A0A372GPE5_9ACTN|nr:hypothetical protein [Actinomadura spongiicola]RFS86979.1 hypothetical protein D0T12_01595 [Actinomadura spongiicola]